MRLPVPLFCITHISIVEHDIAGTHDHDTALMAAVLCVVSVFAVICHTTAVEHSTAGNSDVRRIPDADGRLHCLHTLLQTVFHQCALIHVNVDMFSVAVADLQTGAEVCSIREIQGIVFGTLFVNLIQCSLQCVGHIVFQHFTFVRKTNLCGIIIHQLTCCICHTTAGCSGFFCGLCFTVWICCQIFLAKGLEIQHVLTGHIRNIFLRIVDQCQIRFAFLIGWTTVDHDKCITQIAALIHSKGQGMFVLADFQLGCIIVTLRIYLYGIDFLVWKGHGDLR